jgi:hypothetical protein
VERLTGDLAQVTAADRDGAKAAAVILALQRGAGGAGVRTEHWAGVKRTCVRARQFGVCVCVCAASLVRTSTYYTIAATTITATGTRNSLPTPAGVD